MRFSFILSILLLSLLIWSGCQDSGSSLSDEMGIEGQVYSIGTPGPVPIGWTPLPLERVSTIVILDSNRMILTEVPTDAKGQFKIPLPPGTYFLRVKESPVPAEAGPYALTAGQLLTVEAHFDNGMR